MDFSPLVIYFLSYFRRSSLQPVLERGEPGVYPLTGLFRLIVVVYGRTDEFSFFDGSCRSFFGPSLRHAMAVRIRQATTENLEILNIY